MAGLLCDAGSRGSAHLGVWGSIVEGFVFRVRVGDFGFRVWEFRT